MSDSLERFTAEQFRLVVDEVRRACKDQDSGFASTAQVLVNNFLGEEATRVGCDLKRQVASNGHSVCCPSTALGLFMTGFIHGWKGREMLLETDELEKSFKDSERRNK